MKHFGNRFLAAGLLGLAMMLAACQPGPKHDAAADEAAVRKVLADIVSTFNAGDYDGMLANYEDDVLVQSAISPEITSKQAWKDTLASTMPPDVKLQLNFDTVELAIDGDLAFERGKFTVGTVGNDAQTLFGGRHVHIFRRGADGAWKGWRLFEIIDQLPPGFVPPDAAPGQ